MCHVLIEIRTKPNHALRISCLHHAVHEHRGLQTTTVKTPAVGAQLHTSSVMITNGGGSTMQCIVVASATGLTAGSPSLARFSAYCPNGRSARRKTCFVASTQMREQSCNQSDSPSVTRLTPQRQHIAPTCEPKSQSLSTCTSSVVDICCTIHVPRKPSPTARGVLVRPHNPGRPPLQRDCNVHVTRAETYRRKSIN